MKRVYTNTDLIVEDNGSDEIFISRKDAPNIKIRVGTYSDGLIITASSARLTPWSINGLSAFLITERN